MSGLRRPKRPNVPERMCYECAGWRRGKLDWGRCGERCRYAYAAACDGFERKVDR